MDYTEMYWKEKDKNEALEVEVERIQKAIEALIESRRAVGRNALKLWQESCLCWKLQRENGFIGEKNQQGACMNCRMQGGHDDDITEKDRHCDNCRKGIKNNKDRPLDPPWGYDGSDDSTTKALVAILEAKS